MSKFFIADPLHINQRNFGSLYEYLDESKSAVIFNEERQDLLSLFGDYSSQQDSLFEEYTELALLPQEKLFEASTLEVNLFKVARAELLSLLITQDNFSDKPLPTSTKELFNYIYKNERETLLWNMASAMQWLNHWSPVIKQHNPKFVLVFSGSLIYARSLLELLKNRAPRAFVLESFFTGSDNYIEEKYEPIANNSNLKFTAYYRSLGADELPLEWDRNRNKAINKILGAKNKNVNQPAENTKKLFSNNRPTLLIAGQVLNDFSLLEHNNIGLNSLDFYKKLIQRILEETDLNVIFKAHPWERKKKNIGHPLTLTELEKHFKVGDLPFEHENRLLLLEDYNIKSIFKQTEYVAGLNSQALLEAAFEGFRPIQFANAFYGNKGFTSDYTCESLDFFISDLKAGKIPSKLGLEQYKSYETFITKALQFSLASAFPSGKAMLRSIFHITPHIPLITKTADNQTAKIVQPATPTKLAKGQSASEKKDVTVITTGTPPPPSKRRKKLNKLLKTPKKFFMDSKNTRIRWLHIFFPKGAA
ncbi:hypothetical protein ABH909_002618 [Pseudomonas sp. BS3782 TE3695]|uniref:capsular polysaccharide export protein, LipB/KpsS family n=1 Tax=Pseudomonas sp. BS3782 TE3695 TaxID=3349323 RepID=UPI003D22662B